MICLYAVYVKLLELAMSKTNIHLETKNASTDYGYYHILQASVNNVKIFQNTLSNFKSCNNPNTLFTL